jgi:hypothetical protein
MFRNVTGAHRFSRFIYFPVMPMIRLFYKTGIDNNLIFGDNYWFTACWTEQSPASDP